MQLRDAVKILKANKPFTGKQDHDPPRSCQCAFLHPLGAPMGLDVQ